MSSFDQQLEEELEKLKKKKEQNNTVGGTNLIGSRLSYLPSANSGQNYTQSDIETSRRLKKYDELVSTIKTKVDDDDDDDDIAPVKEDDSRLDFFQKGAFDDGYQFGDVSKSILGTLGDAGLGIVKGFGGVAEGIADAIGYGVAGAADLLGKDDYAYGVRQRAQENTIDDLLSDATDFVDRYSVLGRTSDSIMQGVGQVGTIIATGIATGGLGLGATGTTALTTGMIGISGVGSGTSEAYRSGATDEEAATYGLIAGAADAFTELIFGGLGKVVNATGLSVGLSSADDMLAKSVSKMFSNQIAKNVAEFGIKAGAEGLEEVLAGVLQAAGKKATYMSEEDFANILRDENLLEQFVVGSFTSGLAQSHGLYIANKTGSDFITGMSQDEQAVVAKEVENRIAEREADGTKLTKKEKAAIEAQVEKDMEKGYISTDTIESVLGGETYQTYQNVVNNEDALTRQEESLRSEFDALNKMKQGEMTGEQSDRRTELKTKLEDLKTQLAEMQKTSSRNQLKTQLSQEVSSLVKDSRLAESYNERARRSQSYTADLKKYNAKQQAVIQKAIDSGILNNTNRTHEFVDMVAKISADKGVLFDFTNNAKLKESGFAVDGKAVNGYVTKDGITVNVQSSKSLNSIVGHEITHVLEGTDLYAELQSAVVEYAKAKNDYQGRYDALAKLYQSVEGANIDAELTADLVGDYLFTDSDFINNLSTKHRNVFQKIYDEIKYLVKIATAGSKEARELEKVKRAFDKAYREGGEVKQQQEFSDADTKYSLREEAPPKETGIAYKVFFVKDGKLYPPMVANPDGADTPVGVWLNADVGTAAPPSKTGRMQVKAGGKGTQGGSGSLAFRPGWHLGDLPRASQFDRVNPETGKKELFPENFVWAEVEYAKDVDYQEEAMSYGYTENGKFRHAYAGLPRLPENGYYRYRTNPKPDTVPWVITGAMKVKRILSDAEVNTILEQNGVAPVHRQGGDVGLDKFGFKEDGTVKYSLSDSAGKELTAEQQEYFKDSVVRDESGKLKVMYHGTSGGGHTVFDTYGSNYGLFGQGSYFTDSKDIAQSYTKKGKGNNPQVYEAYLNIKNPIDMDAPADPAAWANAFPDADFPPSGTNEDFYRAMEEYFEDNEYYRWEAAEAAMDALIGMGYDGITHIGGGRVNANSKRHQVYIAFEPEQIKNIDNVKPTSDPDIRYSLSDNEGNQLTNEQAEFFKDSKMRDADGNLKVMYHGSQNGGFHTFDPDYSDDGASLFFVDSNSVAASYSGTSETYSAKTFRTAEDFNKFFAEIGADEYEVREKDGKFHLYDDGDLAAVSGTAEGIYGEFRDWSGLGEGEVNYKVYLNLTNPLEVDAEGKSWDGLPSVNKESDQYEYIKIVEVGDNDVTIEYSMVGDSAPVTESVDLYQKFPYGLADTLSNMAPGEVLEGAYANPSTTRDYAEYAKKNGYDGVVFKNIVDIGGYGGTSQEATVAIAFDSNQVKSTANAQPTGHPDIRYSLSEDSNGRKLSAEQSEYFKDSKAVDANGNLQVVYHGSPADFNTFSLKHMGTNGTAEGYGFYFTDKKHIAENYTRGREGQQTGDPGKLFEVYLDIKKPLSDTEVTMSRAQFRKFLIELNNQVDSDGDPLDVLSNYGDVEWEGLNKVINYAMEIEYDGSDNDVNLVSSIINGTGNMETVLDVLRKTTGYDGIIVNEASWGGDQTIYLAFHPEQIKNVDNLNPTSDPDIRYSLSNENSKLKDIGLQYDANSETVSYSLSSLEDAFDYNRSEADYNAARAEYEDALARSISEDKSNPPTDEERAKAKRYVDSLFLIHDMIATDRDRLDYEAAVNRTAWVSNAEYGGSIDFSTLCAKRRLFTGTFDAIQMALPDAVLNENDFLQIRNMLLAKDLESPCSMCYVEGSRAKHGVYVQKFLKEYLKTNPEWKPQIADFASTTRLEQTRINHPEAYAAYQKAMNALSQRKPKEASVRTDYKGEILRDFKNDTTVAEKNKNGGVRFNSFSDFEIIHALDCMQVITDMARVGLNGQAYTKVKEFAEAFGNTGLKINLSLVAKDVDADGKLIMDETNGMNYSEAMGIRSRYSENVGTVIVVFNDAQLKAALADSTIDYVLPFHRSQWKKSQYTMMGLPSATRDYTNIQNDRYKNPNTGRAKKAPNGNIMPNEYWDFNLSGRDNAQKYLDYINENSYIPKFDFLLNRVDGKWVLPEGAIGDGYFKLLIDFKMYDNDGWGSPQNPVVPEFNMPYIRGMLENYKGGHQAFPVAHDVVSEFVNGKKNGSLSLSEEGAEHPVFGNYNVYGKDIALKTAPVQEEVAPTISKEESVPETAQTEQNVPNWDEVNALFPNDLAPIQQELDNLLQQEKVLEAKMLESVNAEDFDAFNQLNNEYVELQARIESLQKEDAEYEADRLSTFNEADMPPEMEAPIYGDAVKAVDPFDGRDEDAVGNRKVNAYQYENPEVKPFFLEAAYGMLGDLRDTVKGEKWYNDEVYYASGGEAGWGGTKRSTTTDIAYLLDQWHYTYADIEKGLNAIIEDDGKENNAVSKRIEFLLNDRLLNGYTTVWGEQMPANQEYINLINEKQINEYSEEAFRSYFDSVGYEVPVETEEIAPTRDFEAVTPRKQSAKKSTNRLVRADTATAEDQKIAKILDTEPSVATRNSRAWARFKANFLDKGAVFEDLSLKTKNRNLMGKWNYILSSEARAQRLMGNGTENVKSLNSIREQVESSGKSKQFYEYLYHKHNVDRMQLADRYEDTPNKPVFGYSVTADVSQGYVRQYERSNPEFMQYAHDIYDYMNHLRSLMVDNGVISQETADLWAEMYPHYVPIRRAGDTGLNINVPLDTGRTGVNAPVKKATGGNKDILPLFDTMAQRTVQTYKAIAKNSFGVELKNALGSTVANDPTSVDDVIDSIDAQEGLLQEGKNGRNPTFTVFENGEKVTFEITEDMYDALKPVSGGLAYTNKILNTASNFHRGVLTEYNPVFMLTNAIKDAQDVLVNSQHPLKTYSKIPEAFAQLVTKGYWYREYMENGGEQNTYFDNETNTFNTENKGLAKLLDMPPFSTISALNNFIEMAPRLGEYIASREAGRSVEVSMLDAARVTTNFAAGGNVTKFLNRNGATFLNASVQGAMQQVRNFREAKANGLKGWVNLATKFAIAGLPAIILNNMIWDDDEEYEELSDYVKQNYYVVGKYDDGKFIRIPKGRTLAVIQNAFEQVSNALTGDDEVDLATFLELAVSNLAPNNPIENNILAPIIQVANNETWYGEDLVPTRLQDLPAAEQYDESTDSFSKWLGEKLDISPVKINYLLDQYTGGVGDTILPMLTPEAESGDNSFIGNMLAPLKSKFTTDGVINNQNVADFYDKMDELTTNAKASTATDEDVLKYKYMTSVNAELSELYKQKREAQNSSLPDSRKYEKVRQIQEQIVDLTRNSLDTYDGVSISGEYATVGDRYFQRSEAGEWQKMSADQVAKHKATSAAGDSLYATDGTNHYRWYQKDGDTEGEWRKIADEQLEKQEEVTLGLGISAEDYWGNKEEYDYAYEHPENYAVAKAVGGFAAYKAYSGELYDIKADKDESGKSISGSRKEKVIDYIGNLDADDGEKMILFKSEYPADDTYNYEIIDYLNNRDDISYEEMETILKKLGFTVKADGTIEW